MSLKKMMAIVGKGKKTITSAADTAAGVLKSHPVEAVAAGGAGVGASGALAALLDKEDDYAEEGKSMRKMKAHREPDHEMDDDEDDAPMRKKKKKSAELD